jgi:hypothetical protein
MYLFSTINQLGNSKYLIMELQEFILIFFIEEILTGMLIEMIMKEFKLE